MWRNRVGRRFGPVVWRITDDDDDDDDDDDGTVILGTKLDNFVTCNISVNPFNLQSIYHNIRIQLLQGEENISKFSWQR